MSQSIQDASLSNTFNRVQRVSLVVGGVALFAGIISAFFGVASFFQSYLYAYLFWLGLALGCMAMLLVQHLVGGSWGAMIRRPLEAGVMVLPLMGILFIPLLLGMGSLYEWTHADVVAASPILQAKTAYLNVPFFIIRAIFYFAVWIGGAYLFWRWSQRQDDGDSSVTAKLQRYSAPGLILYILTMTFAAYDWGMSLEPEWFSGIYGVTFMIGQVISSVAFLIGFVVLFNRKEPLSEMVNRTRVQDLGNFLMGFTMFWAYVSVSQYIIIWSGNIVETASWYAYRMDGEWRGVALFLLVFHFFVPFLVLFSRWVKQSMRMLVWVAMWMILMRFVDLFWIIVPAFGREGFPLHLLDVVLVVGIGGLWLAAFAYWMKGKSLLPLNDPRVQLGKANAHD
ncbi:MAG: hypothetical protein U5L04_12130 [Trueperaceae bacterium]|nr:hypothetical protein [Trueperaceae bacterium]